jgi:hypothetical protein
MCKMYGVLNTMYYSQSTYIQHIYPNNQASNHHARLSTNAVRVVEYTRN